MVNEPSVFEPLKFYCIWDLLSEETVCSWRSKFFSLRIDSFELGGKDDNGRVASPESILAVKLQGIFGFLCSVIVVSWTSG